MKFIKIPKIKDTVLISTELLGVSEAQLWIGGLPDGPTDYSQERVNRERAEIEKRGGRLEDGRPAGIAAVDLTENESFSGWFEVDASTWPEGIYRINIHSKPNIPTPHGTPLRNLLDGEYSWAGFGDDLTQWDKDQWKWLYLERNNAGFVIRIEITPDRTIVPAGDGEEWVERWPQIYEEKVKQLYEVKEKKTKEGDGTRY
jgi:hypothetical protein